MPQCQHTTDFKTMLFVLLHAQYFSEHVVGMAIVSTFRGDGIPRYQGYAAINILQLNIIRSQVVADSPGRFAHQGRVIEFYDIFDCLF